MVVRLPGCAESTVRFSGARPERQSLYVYQYMRSLREPLTWTVAMGRVPSMHDEYLIRMGLTHRPGVAMCRISHRNCADLHPNRVRYGAPQPHRARSS